MSLLKTKNTSNLRVQTLKKNLINPKQMTKLNLEIDSDLHKRFKIKTAIDNISMTEVIVDAINNYLKDRS